MSEDSSERGSGRREEIAGRGDEGWGEEGVRAARVPRAECGGERE